MLNGVQTSSEAAPRKERLRRWFLAAVLAGGLALAAQGSGTVLQWQSVHDPGVGGHVNSVKVSPYDPQRVLAGGDMLGITVSTNGGATWLDTYGLQGGYEVEEFTWHPVDSHTVWAATMGGPYVSTNGGLNWTKQRTGFPAYQWGFFVAPVQKILFNPASPLRLLAFTGSHRGWGNASGIGSRTGLGEVFASTDGGNTWTQIATIGNNSEVMTALWQPGSTNMVFAATANGLYASANGGTNWTYNAANGLPSGKAWWVAVSPAAPNNLWVAMDSNGVFKSTNGGSSFVAANKGLPANSGDTYQVVAVSPTNAGILYAANPSLPDRNLYRSTDGGASWSSALNFGPSAYPFYRDFFCLDIDPANALRVFGGTATTVWRALNGTNFTDTSATFMANNVYLGTGWSGECATDFRFNPFTPAESAICAMDSGKWVSRNSFATWSFGGAGRGKGMGDWDALVDFAFTRTPGAWWALQGQSGNGCIYRTSNGGTNWTATPNPPGVSSVTSQPQNCYAHPDDPRQAWVLWSGMLFRTTNSGAAWMQIATHAGILRVLEGDPRSAVQPTLYAGGDNGVFKSTNGADFAQIVPNPDGNPRRVSRIKPDPVNPSRFYCLNPAWSDQNTWDTGLWRCDGAKWTKLSMEGPGPVYLMQDVDVDPTDNRRLLLGTGQNPFYNNTGETGIWFSQDTGATWSRQNTGLPCLDVTVVRFRPDTSGLVVVGLNGRGYYSAQMPLPVLGVHLNGTNLALSWPQNAGVFYLESATNLALPANWLAWAGMLGTNDGFVSASPTPSGEKRFFRLRSP